MWHGHFGPWCFGFMFLFLFFVFIILRTLAFRRFGGCRRVWTDEAETILRNRLASGEINEEEYQKLKNALKK
jgi:uncharacterized membrane protein